MNDDNNPEAGSKATTPLLANPSPPSGLPAPTSRAAPLWRSAWALAVLVALGLAGWQGAENRQLAYTQADLAQRLMTNDSAAREGLRQTQDQLSGVQGKLIDLEGKLEESRSQQAALENLYQDITRNRDEWLLVEVEQGLVLAAQQLQLAGNVSAALLALQAADARLAGSNRPQFLGLRKALVRDLDRLRALPVVDLPGMGLRLEGIVSAIDTLPLLTDSRPRSVMQASAKEKTSPPGNFWHALQRMPGEFLTELRSLIRIQRFDRDEPVLLAPGQEFYLRENLKLRLLNARLALLARDQATFRSELKQAQAWLQRYFDSSNAALQNVQGGLKQLAANEINLELPTLNESLSMMRSIKSGKERK